MNESKDSNIRLYDAVECGGYYWIVVNLDGDIATLLAKDGNINRLYSAIIKSNINQPSRIDKNDKGGLIIK